MKSKELIRQLLEVDPSGEVEVNAGGADIYFVSKEPGYYDGAYQVLQRAEHLKPYYDIIGIRICRQSEKIRLVTVSADDFLLDKPDGLIQYDSESTRERYEERIERTRKENKEIIAKLDAERDEEFEKDKQRIITNNEHRDIDLAKFLQDILTKGVQTQFGQTLSVDGNPLPFNLPNLPDERSKKSDEIFSQVWGLLNQIKDLK